MPGPKLPARAPLPRTPEKKRWSWSFMSWRRSVRSPVTVASAAYISAYQLTWLSRIVG